MFHQNIRSFNHNFDPLAQFIDSLSMQVDVILLTETWFSEFNKSNITGYNSLKRNIKIRFASFGSVFKMDVTPIMYIGQRGASVFVKENLISNIIIENSIITDAFEPCVVEINISSSNEKLIVYGLYQPPSSSITDFLQGIDFGG